MIRTKNSYLFVPFFYFLLSSNILVPQTQEDLEFLDLLPNKQAMSIAEKLGVQTGKPISDEVVMDTFDSPEFPSTEAKNLDQIDKDDNEKGLSIFGMNLFKDSPTTFAPIDLAPAPKEYVIGPGDELRIQLFGTVNINRVIPVNREGNVVIPEVGVISVSGLLFSEVNNKIKSSIDSTLIGVNSEVSLSKIRSIQVFVLGNSYSPGAYTVSSLSNISNILFVSGGPDKNGTLRNIKIKRAGEEISSFDFYDLLVNGIVSSDIRLQSNDAIVIEPIGKRVKLFGSVKKEAFYELKEEENFSDLLNFASGFSNVADKQRITISTLKENGERFFVNYKYEELESIKLYDGDEVFVHKLSNTPRNIIRIIGELASSGSFAYEEGITISDVIKSESFLETTYTPFAIVERENSFGSKSLLKANLLSTNQNDISLRPNDIIYVLSRNDINFLNSILVADALNLIKKKDSDLLSNYFNARNLDRFQCKSLQILAKHSSSSSIKFVSSKYLPNPNLNPIDQLEFVNECPAVFEAKPYLIIFTLENSSVISGEVRNPGIYPSYKVLSAKNLLSFAGGSTEKSSGMMDIFTDEGKSVKIDIKDDQALQDIGIKSSFYANIAAKSNKEIFSVSLEGAFVSPGIYGVQQGERLSDVIKRAGGYKDNAYTYGGILARKSVAEKEKLAFMRSADQLEQSIATAISSGRISSVGGDPTLALTSISNLISNLQDIEPIGRVVTEFDFDLLERSPQKDLLLEPGDRIFIPERSSTITVSGQVLSPTSFSFDPTYKVKNYIDLAGGYSEEADRNRTLVIYPNGMASRVRTWPNSPDLAPGTTLVVPRDPNPFDWLVFSQVLFPIISNFATSAAAIAALETTIKTKYFILILIWSGFLDSSIEDYLYYDIGPTSNIHGELGLINIPSARILDEGNLKLHLVNSDPINSLLITANPFNWMEVSLRYADINTIKYSQFKSFSGEQTYKDKSFNLKINLIRESERFPALSLGFRDFIGTGKFSGEYLVTSKKVGDFDFTVGIGWGSLASRGGLDNPFIQLDESFKIRSSDFGKGGEIEFDRWFRGKKASSFYGFEYNNKYSGLRFKIDYDSSNPFNFEKKSDFSFGISIPASEFLDINLFRHRGTSIGLGVSYKANYSKELIKKNDPIILNSFNDQDKSLLNSNDDVFSGTINVMLQNFGIFTQNIYLEENSLEIVVDQNRYRNLNLATKRSIQSIRDILETRDINKIHITYQVSNVNIGSVSFSLRNFLNFLDNSSSVPELRRNLNYENYYYKSDFDEIFKGEIDFPIYFGGIRPELKNHIGAPEAFYSGQLGLFAGGGVKFNKRSVLEGTLSLSLFENLDQLRLRAFSRLPKVRSDVREYLKEEYAIKDLTYSYIFDPKYSKNSLFFGGLKVGLFEEMFGGIGGEILYRDISKPWYLTASYYWVKQRQFNQRLSFRNYETFTGHLNFIWDTPISGVKLILSGGRYLAKDSGITMNMSKTFKTGFVLGFYATKSDISAFEFGEGSFDKGIYFSIPLDLVSRNYRNNNARFVWKNLTRDGGAMLSGGLDLYGFTENTSSYFLDYFSEGFNQ